MIIHELSDVDQELVTRWDTPYEGVTWAHIGYPDGHALVYMSSETVEAYLVGESLGYAALVGTTDQEKFDEESAAHLQFSNNYSVLLEGTREVVRCQCDVLGLAEIRRSQDVGFSVERVGGRPLVLMGTWINTSIGFSKNACISLPANEAALYKGQEHVMAEGDTLQVPVTAGYETHIFQLSGASLLNGGVLTVGGYSLVSNIETVECMSDGIIFVLQKATT